MGGPHDYYTEDTGGTGGSWGGGEDFGSPFSGNNSPPATSNEGGNNNWNNNNNNNNNNSWSSNDWANEFANTPTVIQESEDDYYEEGPAWWDAPAGTDDPINYVPWQTSSSDNFISALGGLDYNWVDPDSDFFLDPYGDQIGSPGYGLWNPFIAGYDPETGEPIHLTTSQFNEIMAFGEAGSPWETEVQTGGNNPGGSGWGGNWGGSNLNYGNRSGYGKYADWGNRPFMTQSFDSPMPQYYASLKNPGQPTNIAKFNNMMGNMYNSGIRSLG